MKCSISQPDFAKAISAVLGVVDKRGTMPILSNVLLKANGDGGIHVSATDLEVSYKGFCPASIEAPGAITVPAHQLASLVKDMPRVTCRWRLPKTTTSRFSRVRPNTGFTAWTRSSSPPFRTPRRAWVIWRSLPVPSRR